MRDRSTLLILAVMVTALGTPDRVQGQDPALQGFREYVAAAVESWDATGLAIAVVTDGRTVFAEGFGVRELGSPARVDAHTRFAIGSTTKAMTAAAIGMLVDEGKVSWDDLVIDYLPWFRVDDPYVTSELTLRDLLTHRGGMGNADFLWYEREATTEEIVRAMALVEPAYSLRSSFIYQNIMYAAAGEVIEVVSGVPWSEFVRTRIFGPLGMTESVPLLAETVGAPNMARPHYRIDGQTAVIENASVDPIPAAGSVWSSVTDMSKWLTMLLAEGVSVDGTRILSEATVEEMFRPQALVPSSQFYPTQQVTKPDWMTYGLAWFQHDYRGYKLDFHTGSIDGMIAIAGLIRDLDIGVYVLANRDHVEVRHALMYRALDQLIGGEVRDWSAELKPVYDGLEQQAQDARSRAAAARVEGTSPSLPLDAYVGTYRHPLYGSIIVTGTASGALRADIGPGQPGAVEHWNFDTFRVVLDARWRGAPLIGFTLGSDGKVTGLSNGGVRFSRVDG